MTSKVLRRLGSMTVTRFMREAWQRKPLVLRGALANFEPPVERDRLLALARQPEVEARLIERLNGTWRLRHGPFARLPSPRRPGWTLLVQGVDLLDEAAHRLLQRFRFVPDARLDDLMMSYATDGGGVGPHIDSYDVFLLQAVGRRRWRISRQRDLRRVTGLPLQILANFRATAEFVLEPGDMLYLPPGVAHEGTALGECVTYSIGFRAPTHQELLEPFLSDFAAHAKVAGQFEDRGLHATRHPGALPASMVARLHAVLSAQHPQRADCARFLLAHLSEPKAQVVFDRPRRPLRPLPFAQRAREQGVFLDRRTRFLYSRGSIGVNGEFSILELALRGPLQRLSDRRELQPIDLSDAVLRQLHSWYLAGWLHLAGSMANR